MDKKFENLLVYARAIDENFIQVKQFFCQSPVGEESEPEIITDYYVLTGNGGEAQEISVKIELKNSLAAEQLIVIEGFVVQSFAEINSYQDLKLFECLSYRTVLAPESLRQVGIYGNCIGCERWSSEQPNQYHFVLIVKNHKGQILEIEHSQIGFRQVQVEADKLIVNQQLITVNGIDLGESMAGLELADMLEELSYYKSLNINSVMVDGQATPTLFYELCGYLGLYVVDKIEINPPHKSDKMAQKEKINEETVARQLAEMVGRHRIYSALVMYLVCDHSGSAMDIFEIKKRVYPLDNSRKIDYMATTASLQKAIYLGDTKDYSTGLSEKFLHKQQVVSAEAAIKTAFQPFAIELVRIDKDTLYIDESGASVDVLEEKGEPIHYSEVRVTETMVLKMTNRHQFVNLNIYEWQFQLLEDGAVVQQGAIDSVDVQPGQTAEVLFAVEPFRRQRGALYHLNVFAINDSDFMRDSRGAYYSQEQLLLEQTGRRLIYDERETAPTVGERALRIDVVTGDYQMVISKKTGDLISYSYDGQPIMKQKMALTITKDGQVGKFRLVSISKNVQPHYASILVTRKHSFIKGVIETLYTFHGDGTIYVSNRFIKNEKNMKVVLDIHVGSCYDIALYFGRGEKDSYSNEASGTRMGIFEISAAEFSRRSHVHSGIEWYQLEDPYGKTIVIENCLTGDMEERIMDYEHTLKTDYRENSLCVASAYDSVADNTNLEVGYIDKPESLGDVDSIEDVNYADSKVEQVISCSFRIRIL